MKFGLNHQLITPRWSKWRRGKDTQGLPVWETERLRERPWRSHYSSAMPAACCQYNTLKESLKLYHCFLHSSTCQFFTPVLLSITGAVPHHPPAILFVAVSTHLLSCFFNSYPSQSLPSLPLHLLSAPSSILALWMVKSHRNECNMSLFFFIRADWARGPSRAISHQKDIL